jgi:hypothetical protein
MRTARRAVAATLAATAITAPAAAAMPAGDEPGRAPLAPATKLAPHTPDGSRQLALRRLNAGHVARDELAERAVASTARPGSDAGTAPWALVGVGIVGAGITTGAVRARRRRRRAAA